MYCFEVKESLNFLSVHGKEDNIVPYKQSVNFVSKVREIAGDERVILELIDGARYADPKFDSAKNVKKVLDYLDRHLK